MFFFTVHAALISPSSEVPLSCIWSVFAPKLFSSFVFISSLTLCPLKPADYPIVVTTVIPCYTAIAQGVSLFITVPVFVYQNKPRSHNIWHSSNWTGLPRYVFFIICTLKPAWIFAAARSLSSTASCRGNRVEDILLILSNGLE